MQRFANSNGIGKPRQGGNARHKLSWTLNSRTRLGIQTAEMVSPRRADANARNAKFSTGPKTKRGKFRSRKNALRHGLATSIGQDPQLRREAIKLSSAIAHELGYSTDSPFTE